MRLTKVRRFALRKILKLYEEELRFNRFFLEKILNEFAVENGNAGKESLDRKANIFKKKRDFWYRFFIKRPPKRLYVVNGLLHYDSNYSNSSLT